MLAKRIIVSIIGIPVLIILLLLGGPIFSVAVSIIVLFALSEFYQLYRKNGVHIATPLGLLFGVTLPIITFYLGYQGMIAWLTFAMLSLLFWRLFTLVGDVAGASLTFFGIFYVAIALSHLVLIYKLESGASFVFFTFIATWIADTAAYAVGRIAGKRPLAEKISPNKTIEGFLGALTINALIFAALIWVPILSLLQRILFALILTVFATAGDLVESIFKREVRVKDSGKLIPGHGGFLDRFDSMIFTSIAAYYLINIL